MKKNILIVTMLSLGLIFATTIVKPVNVVPSAVDVVNQALSFYSMQDIIYNEVSRYVYAYYIYSLKNRIRYAKLNDPYFLIVNETQRKQLLQNLRYRINQIEEMLWRRLGF